MTWRSISPSRIAAGKLAPSTLMLDYLERDWSAFEIPFSFQMGVFTPTVAGTTKSVSILLPSSWGLDDSFDPDMQLRFSMRVRHNPGLSATSTVTIKAEENAVHSTLTSFTLNTDDPETIVGFSGEFKRPIPTTLALITIEATTTSDFNPSTVDRDFGLGPDSRLYFFRG